MKLKFENIPTGQASFFTVSSHDSQNPCQVFWHYHPECELVYVPGGTGRRQVGQHTSQYTNGDLVLIGPNVPHLNFNYQAKSNYQEVVIQFQRENLVSALGLFPEFFKLTQWLKSLHAGIAFGEEIRNQMDTSLRGLLLLPPTDRTLLILKMLHTLSTATDCLYLDTPVKLQQYQAYEGERINRVYDFVKEHYQLPIATEEVVALTGLSQAAFCRFFRKMTKMSFTDFVNEFRINKACQMLLEGYPVTQVAYANGFNSISHFNVSFKKKTELTPTQYISRWKSGTG